MIVTYRDEKPYEVYKIVEEEAEGLTVLQVKEIVDELGSITTYSENVYDVICSLRDYLSFLNTQTTAAVLKRQQEQQAKELKAKAEQEERKRRQI
jgi:hypothetical protein